MANVKICNLDLISPVNKRELVIGEKSYEVLPLSVGNFIEFNMIRQKIVESEVKEALEMMIGLVKKGVPKIPASLVEAMSLQQLQMVVAFIFDEVPDEVLNNEPAKKSEEVAEGKSGN